MEKQIFKKGDKVYHYTFGWGEVLGSECGMDEYPVAVEFVGMSRVEDFTSEGKYWIKDINPTLSFTEYTLQGFSQERPIDLEDHIGKWGIFSDGEDVTKLISKLIECRYDSKYQYMSNDGFWYKNFKPLPEVIVKGLGLD